MYKKSLPFNFVRLYISHLRLDSMTWCVSESSLVCMLLGDAGGMSSCSPWLARRRSKTVSSGMLDLSWSSGQCIEEAVPGALCKNRWDTHNALNDSNTSDIGYASESLGKVILFCLDKKT